MYKLLGFKLYAELIKFSSASFIAFLYAVIAVNLHNNLNSLYTHLSFFVSLC